MNEQKNQKEGEIIVKKDENKNQDAEQDNNEAEGEAEEEIYFVSPAASKQKEKVE